MASREMVDEELDRSEGRATAAMEYRARQLQRAQVCSCNMVNEIVGLRIRVVNASGKAAHEGSAC
ncbi:hypothetical protein BOTBODRAFT_38127 [Botryobasidium botryosum FD-172 SS1]|uniref:Uncharacterized protein n=1 Tax=Botryobasidium botryosum (strain FD-172 SS1) TaxID=930990 RepID=A0A067M0U1_BOTB1|nr:hypothetical protein BOTBODRAFT_38127 [Botryobasidium botryosum FD-172 SS1]